MSATDRRIRRALRAGVVPAMAAPPPHVVAAAGAVLGTALQALGGCLVAPGARPPPGYWGATAVWTWTGRLASIRCLLTVGANLPTGTTARNVRLAAQQGLRMAGWREWGDQGTLGPLVLHIAPPALAAVGRLVGRGFVHANVDGEPWG